MKLNTAGITRNTLPVAAISVALSMLILAACSGGGSGGSGGGNGGGSGLTQMGGALQGVVLNLSKTVSTFVGLSSSNKSADGIAGAASFNAPEASVLSSDGKILYIADSAKNTIRKIVIETGEVTTLAGSSVAAAGSLNGTGTAATFSGPRGITTDGFNLYVADTGNNIIRVISPASSAPLATMTSANAVVTTLAGTGSAGVTSGLGSMAQFKSPVGITTNGSTLFVADTGNNRIRAIAASGVGVTLSTMTSATTAVTTLAGRTSATTTLGNADDVSNIAVRFDAPSGIITFGNYLYVVDKGNNKIRKIVIADNNNTLEVSGETTSFTGSPNTTEATTALDGVATGVTFNGPKGITTDGTYLYVADTGNNKI